jgi:hypothetical protein
MDTHATAGDALLPLTRLVLGVSAVVQLIFGVLGLFLTDLWNRLIWTTPLLPWPNEAAHFAFINYLATAAAAAYALYQGRWSGARVYLVFAFIYNLLSLIVVFITAANSGVPAIMWLLVALGVIYLPIVAVVWQRQSQAR